MSDAGTERKLRINGKVLLPGTLALVLLVVLAGILWTVWTGLTAEPEEMHASGDAGHAPPSTVAGEAAAPSVREEPGAEAAEDTSVGSAPESMAGSHPTDPEPGTPHADPGPAEPVIHTASDSMASETIAEPNTPTPPPVTSRPAPPAGRGLAPAPDPALVEQSPLGPLPRIGPNGLEPWQAYARPVDARDTRPRVAVILSGLGLSSAATDAAIQGLPGEVTLAFQPFADNIQQWIRLSRAAGHEVLLNLPMEPVDFPESDPGPHALFVTLSPVENEERLRWALSRVSGYVGVVNHMGSRFTTVREVMQPVLAELKARGLLFVDARAAARSVATVMASEMQVPRAINDRFLDDREVSRATIDARLGEIERIAKDAGVSIAIGQAFPVTIERVRVWAETLDEKGLALVPVSAVVGRQADR